jgi:hypothetical protein
MAFEYLKRHALLCNRDIFFLVNHFDFKRIFLYQINIYVMTALLSSLSVVMVMLLLMMMMMMTRRRVTSNVAVVFHSREVPGPIIIDNYRSKVDCPD